MTTQIVYTGPPHQTCAALAEQTDYSAALEPGAVYDVPDELAGKLLDSSAHFAAANAAAGPSFEELKAKAAELGVTVDGRVSKQKLVDAIAAHEAAAPADEDEAPADEDEAPEDTAAGDVGDHEPPPAAPLEED